MTSEDNGTNLLENLDHMHDSISSSPGNRQSSTTPPMPPSTQKCASMSGPTNLASNYARHSGYATDPSSSSTPSMQDRSIAEIIGLPFPEFDHKKEVIDPFTEEERRDQAFQEQISEMLLDALIETHAWATARLKPESEIAAEKFEAGITNIMDIEKEQGMSRSLSPSPSSSPSISPSLASNSSFASFCEKTRQRVNEFVGQMRNAIAALTNRMLF